MNILKNIANKFRQLAFNAKGRMQDIAETLIPSNPSKAQAKQEGSTILLPWCKRHNRPYTLAEAIAVGFTRWRKVYAPTNKQAKVRGYVKPGIGRAKPTHKRFNTLMMEGA